MRNFLLIISFFIFCSAVSLQANGAPPVPPSKKENLGRIKESLQKEEEQEQRLQSRMKQVEAQLTRTKTRLIDLAKSIQSNEGTLQTLEERILNLETEQSTIQTDLDNDRQSISRLILALERIRRVPPEALIAKPGEPLRTAQSAMLMQDIIPALNIQAATLKTNLENLEAVTQDLKAKKDKALKASEELNIEHSKLSKLSQKREELYASTHKDLSAQKKNVAQISAQAKNLQDLVQKLENDQKRKRARNQARKAVLLPTYDRIPSAGEARLPISGYIRTAYHEKDAFGAPSKGLSIEGRGGALVVAPMGGVIRFAGHFKNYGNMVIIEHKKGYHSLIAGLEKIDTVVGHSVSAGEPIGLLHFATNKQKPALYYELRLQGKAVNPAKKISGLS